MVQAQNGKSSDRIDFVQSMLAELRAMAEAERCDMLAYLIEMAYVEAGDILARDAKSVRRNKASASGR